MMKISLFCVSGLVALLTVFLLVGSPVNAQNRGSTYRQPQPQPTYRAPANQNRPQFQQPQQYSRPARDQQLGQLRNRFNNERTQQLNIARNLGTIQQGSNKPTGMVIPNGMPKMNRALTPGEIQRGFTGRTTADGRALIKFNNRILVVPASRISGLSARLAAAKNGKITLWNAQQRATINRKIVNLAPIDGGKKVAATSGGGPGGGRDGYVPSNDNSNSANRVALAGFFRESGKEPTDIFRHSRGWDASKPINPKTLKSGTELCQWQVAGQKGAYFAPCGSSPSKLGISESAMERNSGNIVPRTERRFVATKDILVLEGTAAKVVDDWSIPSKRVETEGGSRQYLIKNDDLESIKEV